MIDILNPFIQPERFVVKEDISISIVVEGIDVVSR